MKRLFIPVVSLSVVLLAGYSGSPGNPAYHSSSEGGVVRADNAATPRPTAETSHQANSGTTSDDNDCDCGDRR